MTPFFILLGILVLFGLYLVGAYNKLVRKRSMVEEGWSGIDVQLKKRYNIIPNLVEVVKGYASHEKETLNQVIQARNSAINASDVASQQVAENNLSSALGGIFALGEAYPDLKANQNFLQLQQEVSKIENDIEKSRRYYNATVRENNIMVESFPSNIIANMFNFNISEYFELEDEAQRDAPKIKF